MAGCCLECLLDVCIGQIQCIISPGCPHADRNKGELSSLLVHFATQRWSGRESLRASLVFALEGMYTVVMVITVNSLGR